MSLRIEELTFGYKGKDEKIFRDFSTEFPYGAITAVTGKNGAGKTTLARIIAGILKPERGRIFVDDMDITGFSLAERGRIIGYAMQNPERQIFSATVEEEMRYGLLNLRLDETEIEARVEAYLALFGMEYTRKAFPFSLSHGEKQRLVLAAILAMKPRYLILDEPTAGLDNKNKERLGNYLKKLECGVAVISHDRAFINTHCTDMMEIEEAYE